MSPEEMLEAMNKMIKVTVRETIKEEIELAVAPINQRLDSMQAEIDKKFQEQDKKLEEIKEHVQQQEEFERGTRVLIENEVMPAVRTVAEQHGEIIRQMKALSQRRESSVALRQHVKTMDDVILNHTDRIEQLEAKAQ